METLSAVNRHRRFGSTAMALCNEAAAQWRCDRASLGMLKGRYVQVKALSHAENFSRKMQVVQDLEAAMEECLDQDGEIIHPARAGFHLYQSPDARSYPSGTARSLLPASRSATVGRSGAC